MSARDTVLAFGLKIDPIANAFLARGKGDMYRMLRYFMGYLEQDFTDATYGSGKRIRPALILFIGELLGGMKKSIPAALSVELFHNFTLIHDDIEDNDELRRGRPTVWKLWGVNSAINAGDAQLLLALQALHEGETHAEAERFLLAQYVRVIEGQQQDFILEEASLSDPLVSKSSYKEMIEKKSAALFGASAAVSAVLLGSSKKTTDALYAFGLNLGMAYQLHDDAQSLWAETSSTGKTIAGDIRERKKTFPIICAYEHGATELESIYTRPHEEGDIERVLKLLDQSDTKKELGRQVNEYLKKSVHALQDAEVTEEGKVILTAFVLDLIPNTVAED